MINKLALIIKKLNGKKNFFQRKLIFQKKAFFTKSFSLISLISFLSLTVLVSACFASQQMDDFLYQYEKYHEVYKSFTTAKEKYLKYRTLIAKDEAVEAVSALIDQRYQTLRTYFLALIWKLRSTPGVVGKDYRDQLIGDLDKQVLFMDKQMDEVSGLTKPDLEDLFILSDRFENKEKEYKSLSYQSLSAVLLGKMRDLQSDSIVITSLLKTEIQGLETAAASQLNDWLREVENQNYLSQKQIEEAEIILEEELKGDSNRNEQQMAAAYNNIKKNLRSAKQFLTEAARYEKEILKVINSLKENE
jgi:hypothetical protein